MYQVCIHNFVIIVTSVLLKVPSSIIKDFGKPGRVVLGLSLLTLSAFKPITVENFPS